MTVWLREEQLDVSGLAIVFAVCLQITRPHVQSMDFLEEICKMSERLCNAALLGVHVELKSRYEFRLMVYWWFADRKTK